LPFVFQPVKPYIGTPGFTRFSLTRLQITIYWSFDTKKTFQGTGAPPISLRSRESLILSCHLGIISMEPLFDVITFLILGFSCFIFRYLSNPMVKTLAPFSLLYGSPTSALLSAPALPGFKTPCLSRN
jgi:hypothetical protein